ncbi:MAG: TerC family protein [Verrucomicrobia bacterium]|nr:TerC family protein [Verrucomicrobiota bacterium]
MHLLSIENLVALLTLTAMEIVLGIDNIVFLAILTGRLPAALRRRARMIGLSLALILRVILLFTIKWIMGLTAPLFEVFSHAVTGRDLILLAGGLFLVAKATHEIHERVEGDGMHAPAEGKTGASFAAAIVQIALIDLVFSLDSVITAVGMAKEIAVMIAAVLIAVMVMMAFAGTVSDFVERHPTIKMLALSFLLLIGVMLVADGAGRHIEKGYVYFAMAFSLGVEVLNIRASRKSATKSHA